MPYRQVSWLFGLKTQKPGASDTFSRSSGLGCASSSPNTTPQTLHPQAKTLRPLCTYEETCAYNAGVWSRSRPVDPLRPESCTSKISQKERLRLEPRCSRPQGSVATAWSTFSCLRLGVDPGLDLRQSGLRFRVYGFRGSGFKV